MSRTDPTGAVPLERLGRYRLIRKIAVGGMAEIYLARVTGAAGFAKDVVVKRILPQLAESEEFFRMFLDEARIAATLQHPNVVQIYDAQQSGGEHFIAMEYLEGADLHTIRRVLAQKRQGLPIQHSVYIVASVAAGLHYAHEKQGFEGEPLAIVHRDVTPQNVILTRDGGVKLVNFGIAKAANRMSSTMLGTLKGKLAYMSPEQCRSEKVDRRTDIYSLGIILFELTTGKRLYGGRTEYEVMREVVEGHQPRPSEVLPGYPPDLEEITLRALARDPANRYQTALALHQDLEKFARARGVVGSPLTLSEFLVPLLADAERERDARVRRRTIPPGEGGPAYNPDDDDYDDLDLDRPGDQHVVPGAPPGAHPAAARPAGAARPISVLPQVDPLFDPGDVRIRRSPVMPILLVLLLAAAGAGAYYYFTVVQPRAAERAAIADAGPPPVVTPEIGSISVDSQPPGAAVWIKIGRTPALSMPVDPAAPHLVRVEQDGYQSRDLLVAPDRFVPTPAGGGAVEADVTLELATASATATPVAEPTVMPPSAPGAAAGSGIPSGRIRVSSNPTAATAWLLVAVTPGRIGPIATASSPELRIAADGHVPAFVTVEHGDFPASGEAHVSQTLPAQAP